MFDIESERFHKGMPMARASLAGTVRTHSCATRFYKGIRTISIKAKDRARHSRTDHA
ncbi:MULTISPECIES: hypothetical protein [Burkholderia cepacia complex]|jgi:hypothetical protein|uniref:hypothetical protein n=1 Tax=Burkholderia cepacia complex TaxID=87882 RepID=UPI001CF49458|nr:MULTISPECIES: hypothetical protein [Burkholderia cepacia complex]MCA8082652.1 hypothetical protein [Burkholderia cenocepacia]